MSATVFSPGRFPLVGRDAELDRAQQALERALGGDGRIVLVSGEPGIGKTRLVEELVALAADEGAHVAWGRVDDVDGAPPYWPWMQLLDAVFGAVDPATLADALGVHATTIAALVPTVPVAADAPPPPHLDPAAARFRLHHAIVETIRALAGSRPLVLALEDVHWADASSLELMRFIAARLAGVPVMLVVTYRTVDAGDTALLTDVLASLARQPALERIELDGLTPSEVGVFMAHTTGLRPRRATAARIHARSEGNPFFVGEIARLQQSEAGDSAAQDSDEAVPLGVRDVIGRRVARLPEQARELLALGGVVGREFAVALLAESAGLGEPDTAAALEPALAAGLLVERDGRLRFSHALVRDTVYRELSALTCATLHARIGDALDRRPETARAPITELAWHFARAAPVLGPERGLAYTLRAAEAAEAAMSYERAEDDLRRALRLIAMLPAGVDRWERELDVQNRIAALIFMTEGMAAPAAAEAGSRARWLCEQIGETDALFHTLNRLATVHQNRAEFTLEREIGEQLLTMGRRRSSPEWLASGHVLVGAAQLHGGQPRAAEQSLARARAAGSGLDLTAEVADAFYSLHPLVVAVLWSSRCAWVLGATADAREFVARALGLSARCGHPHTTAMTLFLAGHLDVLERDAPAVLERAEEALAFADEHALAAWKVWFQMLRGWALAELGGADAGVALMTSALAASHASGTASNRPIFLSLLADGERRRGDPARALALIDQALEEMRETVLWHADLLRRRAELLVLLGPGLQARARDELRRAIAIATEQGTVVFARRAEAALAHLSTEQAPATDCAEAAATDAARLSPRERELLGLLGRGLTDREIAGELVISLATVRSHLDRIRDKTGRRRRPELSRLADELRRNHDRDGP